MRPMLGWKVIEGKQDFFIFLQTFAGLWKFDLVTGDELSRKLPEPLCGSAPGTFHGSVAWLCPEHFSAFYPVCWPPYAPSTAAALLGHILPAGRSRIQANRRQWPASARWKAPGV